MRLKKIALVGSHTILESLDNNHLPGLASAIEDGELWKVPVTIVPHPCNLQQFLRDAQSQYEAGKELAFATIDRTSGSIVGSTRFRCLETAHKRVEIGFTFIASSWQRTHINTEAKYLMLKHAFEEWRLNRVEFLTDVLNTKSRNAIARLGASEEGVLRSHMVMRDGRIRDSVIFSIISAQWPEVKAALEAKLQTS